MAIGEAGSITTNSPTENEPITVNLTDPLTDPVFALSATNNGGNQFVLRVIDQTLDANGDTTSFTFIIEEWEYHDGPHGATETINWIAVEEGLHTLPDGRIIEAGTSSVDHTSSAVSLTGGFTDPPVVLTSVMSENDTITVDSDPDNVTASGFDLQLQEEEGQDGVHAAETVGWIAIQGGGDAASGTANNFNGVDENTDVLSLGDTFTNGIVVAETQTINGGDTATVVIDSQTANSVGVFIEEEASNDTELNHANETVGIVAFESGIIPCFTSGTRILTPLGYRAVETLKVGDLVHTADHGPQMLRWAGRRSLTTHELSANEKLRPIRICAGALGGGLPTRDLVVSRQHRMLISSKIARRIFGTDDVLLPAVRLTALPGIYIEPEITCVTYHHLLFSKHEILLAESAPTESLYFGPQAMKSISAEQREEIRTLFPEFSDAVRLPKSARHIPERLKQTRLINRHMKNGKPLLELYEM